MNQINKLSVELGIPRIEATRPMLIEIENSDLKSGVRKNPSRCAFSLACRRSDRAVKAAYFFRSTAWLQYEDKLVRYHLPPSMQKEIVSFDRNKTMDPGLYRMSPFPKCDHLANVRKRARKGRQATTIRKGQKVVRHHTTSVRAIP